MTSPLRFPPPLPRVVHAAGCKDCEFDRLQNWAVEKGIIIARRWTTPLEVSNAIIDYLEKLEKRARGVPVELPIPRGHFRRTDYEGWSRCSCGWDPREATAARRTSEALRDVDLHIKAHDKEMVEES